MPTDIPALGNVSICLIFSLWIVLIQLLLSIVCVVIMLCVFIWILAANMIRGYNPEGIRFLSWIIFRLIDQRYVLSLELLLEISHLCFYIVKYIYIWHFSWFCVDSNCCSRRCPSSWYVHWRLTKPFYHFFFSLTCFFKSSFFFVLESCSSSPWT